VSPVRGFNQAKRGDFAALQETVSYSFLHKPSEQVTTWSRQRVVSVSPRGLVRLVEDIVGTRTRLDDLAIVERKLTLLFRDAVDGAALWHTLRHRGDQFASADEVRDFCRPFLLDPANAGRMRADAQGVTP
jgi:hypothetical protein